MFSQYVNKFYTFDSFEGLSTDWAGRFDKPKGSYKIHRTTTKEQKRLGIRLLMINYED